LSEQQVYYILPKQVMSNKKWLVMNQFLNELAWHSYKIYEL